MYITCLKLFCVIIIIMTRLTVFWHVSIKPVIPALFSRSNHKTHPTKIYNLVIFHNKAIKLIFVSVFKLHLIFTLFNVVPLVETSFLTTLFCWWIDIIKKFMQVKLKKFTLKLKNCNLQVKFDLLNISFQPPRAYKHLKSRV